MSPEDFERAWRALGWEHAPTTEQFIEACRMATEGWRRAEGQVREMLALVKVATTREPWPPPGKRQ